MRNRPIRSLAAVTMAAPFLAGCYTYRPADLSEVVPESRVRLTVSARQAVELEEALRDTRRTFNATYVGQDDGQLHFEVPLVNSTPGMSSRPVHNRVSVPRGEVTSLERQEFSAWRTATVIAAGVLAVGFGAWEVFGTNNDGPNEDKPPDVNNVRIPLFSFPFGR